MLYIAIIAAIVALLCATALITIILKKDKGSPKMQAVAKAIQQGAMAYLAREYKTIAIVTIIISILLALVINIPTGITFLFGAGFSALAGFIGMSLSIRANVRTAQAAKHGLKQALNVAVQGGAVTGLFVAGLALLGLTILYIIYQNPLLIVGFGFGASLVSLFARIGGGIYTKAADVGADLVGKIEKGIPEDDPRNPAVIADNVGDNVGDCAGMGADLFETYAVTAIGAMLLGGLAIGSQGIIYPLLIGAISILASIIGLAFIRVKQSIMAALYKGLIATVVISAILLFFVLQFTLWLAALIGLIITFILFAVTEYFTSTKFGSVKGIAQASQTGPATNIITGLAVGMKSTWPVLITICAGILISFAIAGLYGIAIAVMAMLSLTGMIVTLDSYGPITDNAGGIAEMAGLEQNVKKITDSLDAVGNTTKAVTKTFAIGSAALAALTLFAAYVQEVEIAGQALGKSFTFTLSDPLVLVGLLLGALIPFIFSSSLLSAVGKAAFKVVEEVRRQFKLGVLTGKAKPDYAKAVDIVTAASLKAMLGPILLAIISPLAVGFILGPKGLGGLLLGVIISGVLLAVQLAIGGAAWDNAKKWIEKGNLGGKGSETHKAAVVGDTVGDPCKDTAGPAINPLIKVVNTLAIIFTSLIVAFSLI
jgi:K(+)-stimulated pyrophosphate-energized sodium pump